MIAWTRETVVKPTWERVVAIFWLLFVLSLAVLAVSCMTACGARQCKSAPIVITSHPTKPRPAGRVTVGCDGAVVADIEADEVVK